MFSFIETRIFSKLVKEYLSDEEYSLLQRALIDYPELGPVIQGTGGVRKARWGVKGRGKRSGLRIIYYVKRSDQIIWLLTMYPKNVADNIAPHILDQIRKEIEDENH